MDSKDGVKRVNLVSKPQNVILAAAVLAACAVPSVAIAQQGDRRRVAPRSEEMRVERDVPYAEGSSEPLQTLDLYAPKTPGSHPVAVYIHGGGFAIGDKVSGAGIKPLAFTRQGYVFVSVNYRLSPAVQYPVHAQDVAKAIAWVHRNASRYGGDPKRLFVMGHSAGAQLAALVSTDDRFLAAESLSLGDLRGAVLLDGGTYDISAAIRDNPRKDGNLTPVFGRDPAVWKQASPFFHVAKGKGIPPFLVIYVATRLDSHAQSEALVKALVDAGGSAVLRAAANKTHASLNKDLGQPDDEPTNQVFSFLRGQLALK